MPRSYDVVVIGANVAGSSMSYNLAKAGLKVAMLDLLPSTKIGSDSCGDGLDVHEFKRLGLQVPTGKFVYGVVVRGKIIAPDGKSSMTAQGNIKAVHRYHYIQYLKDRAVDSGVELIAPARAISPIFKNEFITGLRFRPVSETTSKKDMKEIDSKILVDSSGINACIRKKLPTTWWLSEPLTKKDIAICYKESRAFEDPLDEKFIHGHFSSKIAPGGFYWLATRSNNLMNVGLGINLKYMPLSPKKQLYNLILPRHEFLKKSKIVWHGGGQVPRRRPLGCMVGNGIVAAGDAAVMVNPMNGGGIGPSVFAGKLGGKIVADAIERGDYSLNQLWQYNYQYNLTYGPIQAGNYILRTTLESMSDEQINALLSANLFTEQELIEVVESGKLKLSFLGKLGKFGKMAKHPRLLFKLRNLYKSMETARKFYNEYPEKPDGFIAWQTRTQKFFNRF